MYKTGIKRLLQTLAELDEGPRESEEQHAQSQIQEIHRVSSHLSLSSLTSLRRVHVKKSSKSESPMLSACQNPWRRAPRQATRARPGPTVVGLDHSLTLK